MESSINYLEVQSVDPDEVVEKWMAEEEDAVTSEAEVKNYVLPRRELAFISKIWEEEGPLVTEDYFSESEIERGYLEKLLEQDAIIDINQLDPEERIKSDVIAFENQLRERGYLKEDSLSPTDSASSLLENSESRLYMINPRIRTLFEDEVIRTEERRY
jgi:hypothetical protein